MKTIKIFTALVIVFTLAACFSCAEIYERRAVKAEEEKDYPSAIQWWDKVIERSPDYVVAYIERGVDKSLTGDYRGAIADYSEVIERDSTYVVAYLNRGKNRCRLDDYTLAVADFNAAVRIKGGDANGNLPIMWMEYNTSSPFYRNEPDPRDVPFHEILFERGLAYYELDSLDHAFEDFTFCIKRRYLLGESLFIRGEIYERNGMTTEAVRDYEAALRYSPSGDGKYSQQATERLRVLKDDK